MSVPAAVTRRSLFAAVGAAAVVTVAGCNNPPADDELEDCDAEDFRNRESDCGFTKRKKPARKSTTTKTRPAVKR